MTGLGGMPTPANQLVSPGVFGHVPDAPELLYDPLRARGLLAAAEVAAMLARIGIRLHSEPMDWSRMVEAWSSGGLPPFPSGWRFESGDALSFFQDCLRSRDPARGHGSFNPGFSHPRIDALIEDPALRGPERLDGYLDLTRAAMEEMPLVPLYSQQDIYAASTAVRWQPRLDAKLVAAEMSFAAP